MKVRLSAATFWRWPNAVAVRSESGWVIEMGAAAEEVIPLGVDLAPDYGNEPERLDASVHDIHERLREVALYDDEEAASRLALHCRLYPAPLLCLAHGLPSGHPGGCPDEDLPRGDSPQLKVEQVLAMVTGLDGVRDLAYYLATQRKPARRVLIENALAWPILEEPTTSVVRAELERNGELSIPLARQVVTQTMTRALRLSNLELLFEWLPNQRPAMTLEAHTGMAAYVADFVRHIGADSDVDRSFTCVVCGQPYMPRRAPRPGTAYCTAPECQRERRRINKARQRARESGHLPPTEEGKNRA